MASVSTEEAIKSSLKALWRGVPTKVIKHDLILHGFPINKANIILRWATQFQKKYPSPLKRRIK